MKVKELKELIKDVDDELIVWVPNWEYGEYESLSNLISNEKKIFFSKEEPKW